MSRYNEPNRSSSDAALASVATANIIPAAIGAAYSMVKNDRCNDGPGYGGCGYPGYPGYGGYGYGGYGYGCAPCAPICAPVCAPVCTPCYPGFGGYGGYGYGGFGGCGFGGGCGGFGGGCNDGYRGNNNNNNNNYYEHDHDHDHCRKPCEPSFELCKEFVSNKEMCLVRENVDLASKNASLSAGIYANELIDKKLIPVYDKLACADKRICEIEKCEAVNAARDYDFRRYVEREFVHQPTACMPVQILTTGKPGCCCCNDNFDDRDRDCDRRGRD